MVFTFLILNWSLWEDPDTSRQIIDVPPGIVSGNKAQPDDLACWLIPGLLRWNTRQ
ncbi:MAG: hypothetical protein R2778_05900 [Saprospiraceae bacterium]